MMRRILAAAALLVTVAGSARADGPVVELIAAVKPSVVAIGTHEANGPADEILGTGFAVGDGGHILTALHLVRGAPAGSLAIYVGQGDTAAVYPARQVAADAGNDLALLKIEGRKLPALRLFMGKVLEEGEEVALTGYAAGAAHGLYPATHRGIISAVTPVALARVSPGDPASGGKVMAYQLDATSYPGNSGGPLVDPADGAVVGVVNLTDVQDGGAHTPGQPSGITFATPIPPAIDLLRKAGLEP